MAMERSVNLWYPGDVGRPQKYAVWGVYLTSWYLECDKTGLPARQAAYVWKWFVTECHAWNKALSIGCPIVSHVLNHHFSQIQIAAKKGTHFPPLRTLDKLLYHFADYMFWMVLMF